jgi:acetylornithine deacetylase/succinyl-diaminopimelate desuccinylase-like protein
MKNDRTAAVARAHAYFDSGGFVADLRRRVAIPSASQEPERSESLRDYLRDEMTASLTPLGFSPTLLENPLGNGPPFLVATRTEDADFVSVLVYGHGDTIRGLDDLWRPGLSPWLLTIEGDRLYGRGTADNKGQHSINIGALAAVLAERGRLGFSVKLLIEMGEEVGSVGLRELCEQHRDGLLKADLLIASDGPRIAPDQATLFLGARGGHLIDLVVELRDGGHHSGNFGGLLANPGLILAQALACITDPRGTIRVPEWRPPLPASVRQVLEGVEVDTGPGGPKIDRDWANPGLRRRSGCSPRGTASRFWPSPPARRSARSYRSRRGRTASFATWWARTVATSSRHCAGIWTETDLPMSRCAAATVDFSMQAGLIPPTRG